MKKGAHGAIRRGSDQTVGREALFEPVRQAATRARQVIRKNGRTCLCRQRNLSLMTSFGRIVHCCLQLIHLIYRQGRFSLPREQSESRFMNKLWERTNLWFDNGGLLDNHLGEVSLHSSGLRKNRGRTFDGKLFSGRKMDELFRLQTRDLKSASSKRRKTMELPPPKRRRIPRK